MEKLNELDLMTIEEVTNHVLHEMEKERKGIGEIDKQREFDLRMLRRKIALMRIQERENKK